MWRNWNLAGLGRSTVVLRVDSLSTEMRTCPLGLRAAWIEGGLCQTVHRTASLITLITCPCPCLLKSEFSTDTTTSLFTPSIFFSPVCFPRWIGTIIINAVFNNENPKCQFIVVCAQGAVTVSLKIPHCVAPSFYYYRFCGRTPDPDSNEDRQGSVPKLQDLFGRWPGRQLIT